MRPLNDSRTIVLRNEVVGGDSRWLGAFLDAEGNLHLQGQDLGPKTASVSDDGEYEWFQCVKKEHLPALVEALGGTPGEDILFLLERDYCGSRSYELEATLRTRGIPVDRQVWSG
jgi:hypothetical protein